MGSEATKGYTRGIVGEYLDLEQGDVIEQREDGCWYNRDPTTGEWIVLEDPVGVCSHCVNNTACEVIKKQIDRCTKAEYRFRCPIEVFVPAEEK